MWILRDKDGWPVERIKGRPITNLLRIILHTSWLVTWRKRKAGFPVFNSPENGASNVRQSPK
jgi:hypothetical protein